VISDIDDTIIYTFATDRLRMIYNVLINNAWTRLPFAGVRNFYRALRDGSGGDEQNPFFYISSSSWRIYDVMRDFLEINDMPAGPVLMRAMKFTRSSLFDPRRHDHKKNRFKEILSTFPDLPFILIGDSGQRDAELYTDLAELYPGRIPALYLRDVDTSIDRRKAIERLALKAAEAGSELLLVDTSLKAARHAATRGWIDPLRLPGIEKELTGKAPENKVIAMLTRLTRKIVRLFFSSLKI
jgi:phosphatidate phosphatase APP1